MRLVQGSAIPTRLERRFQLALILVAATALSACVSGIGRSTNHFDFPAGLTAEDGAAVPVATTKSADDAGPGEIRFQSATASRFAVPGGEGSTLELTLEDAIGYALIHNRSLLNHKLDREAQKLSLDLAEDRWRPRFEIEPSVNLGSSASTASVGARMTLRVPAAGTVNLGWNEDFSGGTRTQTFRISKPLLKGAGADVDEAPVRRAHIEEKINVLALRRAVADLVVEVVGAYRALIAASRQVEIAEASLQRAQEQLEATRALIGAGRVAEREVGRSETAIANREIALVRARNHLEAANARLVGILDLDQIVELRPLDVLNVNPGQGFSEPAFEDVLSSRSDFLQAQLMQEIAQIDVTVARNNMLPDLSLTLALNHDEAGRSDTSAHLGVTIPLNDKSPKVEFTKARNRLLKAERNIIETRESIQLELRQAVNDVKTGLRLAEMASNLRVLAEGNLAVEKAKFAQGLSSTFEVAASEDELVAAEQEEADAILDLFEAMGQLDHTAGRTLDRWGIELEQAAQ